MEEESRISKYSSGVNIIIRLDQLWKNTHAFSRLGSFSKWNNELERIWLELARDLFKKKDILQEDPEFIKVKTEFEKFDGELKKLGGFHDNRPEGFKDLSQEQITNRDEQYKVLMKKQLFLARLENYVGKGTTWDDSDDGFE